MGLGGSGLFEGYGCCRYCWIWTSTHYWLVKNKTIIHILLSKIVKGGSAAFASSIMLGPRLGRYDNGTRTLPLGNPVNAVMGLFVLWWGWLAFNSGSTYGVNINFF